MGNEHTMPDFLPSQYSSWLEFYMDALETLSSMGQEPNDLTEIEIRHFELSESPESAGKFEVFTNTWPFYVLKSRALDEVLFYFLDYPGFTRFLNEFQTYQRESKLHNPEEVIDFVDQLKKLIPGKFNSD